MLTNKKRCRRLEWLVRYNTYRSRYLDLFVGVGPQQVAQQPGVGHVCGPRDPLDLLQRFELRRQAPVHAQDLQHINTISAICCRRGQQCSLLYIAISVV